MFRNRLYQTNLLELGIIWCAPAARGAICLPIIPPWQTVYYHVRQFSRAGLWVHLYRELHNAERRRIGKAPHPSVAMMDSQSIKTVEESAHSSGFDVHKHVKGRKRHLLVDTLGLSLSVYVTPADMHDTQEARQLLAGL